MTEFLNWTCMSVLCVGGLVMFFFEFISRLFFGFLPFSLQFSNLVSHRFLLTSSSMFLSFFFPEGLPEIWSFFFWLASAFWSSHPEIFNAFTPINSSFRNLFGVYFSDFFVSYSWDYPECFPIFLLNFLPGFLLKVSMNFLKKYPRITPRTIIRAIPVFLKIFLELPRDFLQGIS